MINAGGAKVALSMSMGSRLKLLRKGGCLDPKTMMLCWLGRGWFDVREYISPKCVWKNTFCPNCKMYFSKLQNVFVQIAEEGWVLGWPSHNAVLVGGGLM